MTKRRKSNWFLNLLIVVCALVFLYAAVRLAGIFASYLHNQKVQEEVKDLFYQTSSKEEISADRSSAVQESRNETSSKETEKDLPEQQLPAYDFSSLLKQNPDVVGWLLMPGAQVDHPVVQAVDNDYYLHRNLYGETEYAGTIFMDYRCRWGESPNAVIYGHNMTDGSMFGHLKQYMEESVWEENPYFWFITPQHVYRCDIFAVYLTTAEKDYIRTRFADDADFMDYVETARSQSAYRIPDVDVEPGDQIMTLSTCNYAEVENLGRQAVHAKITPVS